MKMFVFTSTFVLWMNMIFAQHIEESDSEKPLGALASGEIQVVNLTDNDVQIEYSIDKEDWKKRFVKSKSGIVATLNIKSSKWYVKICNKDNTNLTVCDQYPLLPKKRYIIDYSNGKLVIKKT